MNQCQHRRPRRSRSSRRRSRRSAASWTLMAADCPLDVGRPARQGAGPRPGSTTSAPRTTASGSTSSSGPSSEIDGLHGPGRPQLPHAAAPGAEEPAAARPTCSGSHPEIRDIELVPPVVIAGLPRTGTTHLHNLLAAGPDVPGAALLGDGRAVPDAGRGRRRAGPAPGAHRPGRGLHEPGDAALQAHARDDDRARARGDPAPLQRRLVDADGDARPRPGLARPLPRARPDAALRAPAAPAPGAPAPARRAALAAQVAAAPRAAAGPGAGLPRPHGRRHPPRPGAGDALDADDALLHRPDAPLARSTAARSSTTGSTGST